MKRIRSLIYNGTKHYGVPLCGYEDNQGNHIYYGIPQDVLDATWKEQLWVDVRAERDTRMAEVDWTQTLDCQLPEAKKAEFAAYRQSLRDVPQTYNNPDDVVWPEKPII